MRLAQLARKLSVKPTDIIQFLSSQAVQLEDSANTKVEDAHVHLVISHFAPGLFDVQAEPVIEMEEAPEVAEELAETRDEDVSLVKQPILEESIPAMPVAEQEENQSVNELTDELPDVIRAPKIELSGLKVLGKIELPEKKKKEETPIEGVSETEVAEIEKRNLPRERSPRPDRKPKNQQHSKRNPLAEARERERREQEEKRRQELERKKEIRTKNYLKKVKVVAPVKRVKTEAPTNKSIKPAQEIPKTLWGKFVKWLTTY